MHGLLRRYTLRLRRVAYFQGFESFPDVFFTLFVVIF